MFGRLKGVWLNDSRAEQASVVQMQATVPLERQRHPHSATKEHRPSSVNATTNVLRSRRGSVPGTTLGN